MALEYIFKILILLVAVAVIIGLILRFSSDARSAILNFIKNLFPGSNTDKDSKSVEQETFNSGEIATYIESCYNTYSSLSEAEQEDTICWTLLASKGINANKDDILNNVDPDIRNKVEIKTDFSKSYVVIEFSEVGNRIVVR